MRLIIYGNIKPTIQALLNLSEANSILAANNNNEGTVKMDRKVLSLFEQEELIQFSGESYQLGRKIVFVDKATEVYLTERAKEASSRYSKIVARNISIIKSVYDEILKGKDRNYSWLNLSPIIVGAFLLDLAVGNGLYKHGYMNEFPKDYWLLCFEGVKRTENIFGVKIVTDIHYKVLIGELWHKKVNKPVLHISGEDAEVIYQIYNALDKNTLLIKKHQQLLKLIYLGIIKKQRQGYTINIPLFKTSDFLSVEETLGKIALEIIDEVFLPYITVVEKELSNCAYPADVNKFIFNRLLMESAMDNIIGLGIIPSFPNRVQYNWGLWGWVRDQNDVFPFLGHILNGNG